MDSGNGIAPSRQSLREYLLAAVPISTCMIISLPFFSTYHVVFVFLRLLLFLVHTYWLYLSASISFSLPFFLAFTSTFTPHSPHSSSSRLQTILTSFFDDSVLSHCR